MIGQAALLKQGGGGPGDQPPEPVGGGQDTEQRAHRDKAQTTDHDEYGHGCHGAADWCP